MNFWSALRTAMLLLIAAAVSAGAAPVNSGARDQAASVAAAEGTSIPDPASFLLIGGGLLAIGVLGMRALRA
jgi:hypothetical protein